jgi:CO/xanthine dehydrogenase Mo-binding subunit
VASAIHDAVGVWLTEQPFTPERVLASLSTPGGFAKRVSRVG